jgi:hypothetical protein
MRPTAVRGCIPSNTYIHAKKILKKRSYLDSKMLDVSLIELRC